jgi:SAM-dependent methyltransferase
MRRRLLVAYSNVVRNVPTSDEYLRSFARFSNCEVSYLHVTNGAKIACELDDFDAVLNNYCARLVWPGLVSPDYIEKLRRFRGVKAMIVQDEYDWTNRLSDLIRDLGFHLVFTCVPAKFVEKIYPAEQFPNNRFVSVLTGYVPDDLELRTQSPPLRDRPITIGYRGRDIGARYGRLGFDKAEIARRMQAVCVERGISHDIEIAEEKRIYGEDWYFFIQSCRTMLGTESGSNVFDFDGSLAARYKEMTEALGRRPTYNEFEPYTAPLEGEIDMGQISARIFEGAALRTPLILFEGGYSGAISPGKHYLELKKDFSNLEEVLGRLDDLDALAAMADRAYDHLIASGNYTYRRFVKIVDEAIEDRILALGYRPPGRKWRLPSAEFRSGSGADGEMPTWWPRHWMHFEWLRLTDAHRDVLKLYYELHEHHQALLAQYKSLEQGHDAYVTEMTQRYQDLHMHHQALIAQHKNLERAHQSLSTQLDVQRGRLAVNLFKAVKRGAHRLFGESGEEGLKGNIMEAAGPPPPSSQEYWSRYNVTGHRLFSSAKESLNYFHWRTSQYYDYIDIMPVAGFDRKVVLDYGCGPGHDLVGFATASRPERLIGIDVSPPSLEQAAHRLRLHDAAPELIRIDESDSALPLPNRSIDHIHCSGVLHHVPDPARVLREFRRIVRDSATVRLMVYNYDCMWLHLYAAYTVRFKQLPGSGIDVREAFKRSTDTVDCPISHAWTPADVMGMAELAGFACTHIGNATSVREVAILPDRFEAILDPNLEEEHRLFLLGLTFDARGVPYHGVNAAGIDGCYLLRPV